MCYSNEQIIIKNGITYVFVNYFLGLPIYKPINLQHNDETITGDSTTITNKVPKIKQRHSARPD